MDDREKTFDLMIKEVYDYLSVRNVQLIPEEAYIAFKEHVDFLEYKINHSKLKAVYKNQLFTKLTVVKMGAKMPLEYLEKDTDLYAFIKNNMLDYVFFTTKLVFKFDQKLGVMIPVEIRDGSTSWYAWDNLEWEVSDFGYEVFCKRELLFEVDENGAFTADYCSLLYGITKYNVNKSADFRPYKYQDPACYSHQNLFVVQITWKLDKRASYFHQTHVSMELKDENGFVRSVGQDIFDHVHASPKHRFSRAAKRSSIIKTPDATSYYPKNHRVMKKYYFQISKREHDRIVALVESDKYNHQQTASLMKGNCVTYACSLLKRGLNYDVHADVAGFEILARNLFPENVDNFLQRTLKKLKKLPGFIQKMFFFIPPVYFLGAFLGYINYMASKTGFNDYREYTFKDYLLKPWKVRCDIPRILHDVLERHSDEHGFIDRDQYPSGSTLE